MTRSTSGPKHRDIVTLADLAPRRQVVGGNERRVFGADPVARPQEDEMAGTKKAGKDLTAKPSKPVKGGKLAVNDNLTIVRAAKPKPAKKDLPASKPVIGGRFLPKGGITMNDNLTLVRAAKPKPAKKDLPTGKDVKGGKRIK